MNEHDLKVFIGNIVTEAVGRLLEDHLAVVDNIDNIIEMVGEQWTSPDDVWWIKFDSRLKDFRNYNKRSNGLKPPMWWAPQSKVDSTSRENHVGYVIVRGHTKEDCQDSIRNAVVHLNPWAARKLKTNLVYSRGNAEAIRTVCNTFFARAYITINHRSMDNTIQRAKSDKQNKYNPFRDREFHHRIGQARTGVDASGVNWTLLRPYGLVDCDVDNEKAQAELEQYFKDNNVDVKMKRQSHDGMHYIIPIDQAKNLNFDFMDKYSTNNRRGDPNVLFKPDANIIVYSPVG